ncbi:MAG: DUF4112 domain-containing protein [Nocardioides sp.]|uniref:DUF4112 domain-containing protein n=1 Tax=Nocardioides sp. TaxID=35761 RepID=UPI00239323C4|nr:DUF4112 domain-containing protein [Nocardioides sp.]MDE0776331.1 DUF4112 domain-containing protein [Nocardioides sp.]
MDHADTRDRTRRSRLVATIMDDAVTVPGTRIGVGLDSVIGLVPGVGDLAGSAISGIIVYDAVQARVPVPTLARMGWNLLLDALLGLVPVAGDLADVAHRASRKNLRLLERAVEQHPDAGPPTAGYLAAALGLVVLPLALGLVVGVVLLVFLLRAIF